MQSDQKEINYHKPVLANEVAEYLYSGESGIYIDATFGGGGYVESILPRLGSKARYIGVDRDSDAVQYSTDRFSQFKRVTVIQGELGEIDSVLAEIGVTKVDGFLLDLGVSSFQIDTAARGFSYLEDGPLDMRMDQRASLSAYDVINEYEEKPLADLIYNYGEERRSRRIARFIIDQRQQNEISTTRELAAVIKRAVPPAQHIKTFARVWQALRFEVNDELGQLRTGLEKAYALLNSGGHLVVLSYESLMDRLVKRFLRGDIPTFSKFEEPMPGSEFDFKVLTRKVVRPTDEEIKNNPRARSARLRAGIKK